MIRITAHVIFVSLLLFASLSQAAERNTRVLKFDGVPVDVQTTIKKRFPQAFDKAPTLADIDQIVRWMMTTKTFSNVEVVQKGGADANDVVIMASLLRKISEIKIKGQKRFSENEILKVLEIEKGQTFERKDLVAATDKLLDMYESAGHLNSRIEIDFTLPTPTDVSVQVSINEGNPCKVVEVNFETANKSLATRAKKLAQSLIGKTCSDENRLVFQKKLTEDFAENRYLTAKLSQPAIIFNNDRTQAKFTYLVESTYRYEFIFDGNQYFEDGSIIRQIDLDKLFGLTTSPAADLADRIRKLYHAHGFAAVDVKYNEQIFEEAQKYQIRFTIKEGSQIRIREIEISGNISRPPSYYARFIRSNSSELVERGFYNRKDFEQGYENLKTDLQNQGYLRARIQSVRTEYTKDRAGVNIYIGIDEGPLTQVSQIRFAGAKSFSATELAEVLSVKSEAPLSLKELETSIVRLKDHYHAHGYIEMKIMNEHVFEGDDSIVTYNDANTQAAINFRLQEGPKVVVSSINIDGNSFTKDYVIMRELEFSIGDTLTPEKIDDSLSRLQRMGLFSKVDINTAEENTNIGERTVRVGIQERDPGLFTSGVGVTNERDITYRGNIGVAYRNIGGTGRAVSARLDLKYSSDPFVSWLENKVTLGYLEPYIFGGRNRGRVNVVRQQEFDNFSSVRPLIDEINSVDFLLERDLTRRLKLTHKLWGFANQRKFDRQTYETVEVQNVAKIGPLLEYDRRNDPFNPTKGFNTFINLEYSDPAFGSSNKPGVSVINFAKVNAGFTQHQRLFNNSRYIWSNSIRGGYVTNMGHDRGAYVPSSETFFLGGRSTIRGYTPEEHVPNQAQLNVSEIRKFQMTEDSHFYLLKSEIRFPLVGIFGGALFYDGGAVFISQQNVSIMDPYRDAWGLGIRVDSPVGPVNLDFAFKLDNKYFPGLYKEKKMAFHFSIGAF